MYKNLGQIFLTVTLVLAMIGCGKEEIQYPDPSQNPDDTIFVSKVGIFTYGEEECTADYGTITVPENRENTSSRFIHLPVVRIHARCENPKEPIFCLAGGPGASNMSWMPIDTLLTNHDFVMVGYRGADGSSILDCPEIVKALEGEGDPLGKESLMRMGKAWKTSAARFNSQGIDLTGYTIPECIEDMESIRRVFNYEQINLLSESYGTRVAYIYGLMHPERIHRSVMVAVNPPGRFIWHAQKIDEQINYYSQLWAKDSLKNKLSPDLSATIRNVLKNLPDKWLIFSINPGKVKAVTFALLFQRNTSAMVFDAYVSAEQGDYSGLALMSLAYDFVVPSMCTWGDLATKGVSADYDSTMDYSIDNDYPGKIIGTPFNQLIWGSLSYGRFSVKMIPDSLRKLQYSDVETLLLSGSVDFSTPADYATDELLPYLKNGKQIVLSEFGHVADLRYLNQQMSNELIMSYFDTGIPDTSKIKYVPMDFNVSLGFPEIAKLVLGGVLLILILLTLITYRILRRLYRRKTISISNQT